MPYWSVNIYQLEMLVEGQIQSVCQFHLVFIPVYFNLFHRLSCIIILQVVLDGLRNQQSWYDSLLAVYLFKTSFFVEFQLRAILQNHIIASDETPSLSWPLLP